jgi:glycosyltransferase involved in cell wall biosynthesis
MTPDPTRRDRPVVFINIWREGGMRHYSDSIVHALRGAARVFYLRNYPSDVAEDGAVLDCDFHPLRPRNWLALLRVTRLLRALRPRAVHLNNEQPLLLPLYPLLALMNSVITLHDARSHAGEQFAKRLFHSLHLWLVRMFIRKVIVHSAVIRDALPRWFPRERIHIMPIVNFSLWAGAPTAPPPAPPINVLFFGRILAYKGLDVLLEAFRQLDPAKFRLIIAGEGEVPPLEAPNIEVENRFISDDRLPTYFQRAHIVALPYRAASQSGVAQLAFAFGRSVVSTRVGGLPDIVRDGVNGLLIPPGDATALAAALERLADPSLREKFESDVRRANLDSDAEIRARLLAIYDA